MPDEKSTPEALEGCHAALRNLLLTKQISRETYFKGAIDLAFFWIELGERERASALVNQVDKAYVDNVLRDDIREDPEFAAHALAVATYLDQGLPAKADDEEVAIALMLLNRPIAKA